MAKKPEERDWSEIIAEVRAKAASEANEAAEEIQATMKALVEKVRGANFNEEAERFLAKVRKLADDFSQSEDGPKKTPATSNKMQFDERGRGYKVGPSGRVTKAKYLDDDGTQYVQKPRAKGKKWTVAQEKKYAQNFINKFHES